MKLNSILACGALAVAAVASPAAHAAFVLSEQGVTFTIAQVDADSFTLKIDNLLNATGNWATVTQYGAFEFKNIGSFTGGAINPGSESALVNVGLSNNGCGQGNPQNTYCFTFTPLLAVGASDTFTIDMTGGTLAFGAAGPHLKVNFMNAQSRKVGDNLSLNLPSNGGSSGPSGFIPEPNSGVLALLGMSLLGIGFGARRKAQRD
jgi:hypothetical protein